MAEVLPAPEDCSQPADENCNGPSADCSMGAWSKRFGDFDGQYVRGVASDSAGNVYITGHYYSSIDFGGGATMANGLDTFVAKFDSLGNYLWSRHFGGVSSQKPGAFVVDALGNVIVTGSFAGSSDFGNGPVTAIESDMFLVKLDPTGKTLWSKQFGPAGTQSSETVALDSQNNIVVGAVFSNSIDFGGGAFTTPNFAFAVAKFDANGNHIWSKAYDEPLGQPQLMTLAIDGMGNIGFGGYFYGNVNFGGGILTASASYDTFLVKLDSAGQHLWSKRYGGALGQNPQGMGFDSAGNLYAVGTFEGTIDFGGGNLTTAGMSDVWLAKLDPAGNHIWSKRYGDAQAQVATDLVVTKTGDMILPFTFEGTLNFGATSVTSVGSYDIAFVRIDSAGNVVSNRRFGDAMTQNVALIGLDPTGHLLAVGELATTVDFGQGILTSAGSSDIYLAKLLP